MHTMDDIIQIFVKGFVVQMTVAVKKSHKYNLLDILKIPNVGNRNRNKIPIEIYQATKMS